MRLRRWTQSSAWSGSWRCRNWTPRPTSPCASTKCPPSTCPWSMSTTTLSCYQRDPSGHTPRNPDRETTPSRTDKPPGWTDTLPPPLSSYPSEGLPQSRTSERASAFPWEGFREGEGERGINQVKTNTRFLSPGEGRDWPFLNPGGEKPQVLHFDLPPFNALLWVGGGPESSLWGHEPFPPVLFLHWSLLLQWTTPTVLWLGGRSLSPSSLGERACTHTHTRTRTRTRTHTHV